MISGKLKDMEKMSRGSGLQSLFYNLIVHGVSIDSRTILPGNLYVPIVRVRDGHDFVREAQTKGAAASLWQTDHPNPPTDMPVIMVDDCVKALQNLAASYRKQLPVKIVGITGSNGKTTTKDIIEAVLRTKYKVHKTFGNLNSQIGVPLTLLDMAADTDIAVIEMGMSERGQIAALSQTAKPDIAVITMIGVSHLSSLGSREAITAAKLEITEGMPDSGVLVYHGDEPLLVNGIIGQCERLLLVRFGEQNTNPYRAESIQSDGDGTAFKFRAESYHVPLLGKHNVLNALAAIAVAEIFGISPDEIRKGFRELTVTGMRMEMIQSPSGFTIINDAWNASPVSVKAAIETFEELHGYSKKILVLGDMLELGDQEIEFHREIGRMIDPHKIDYVITVGDLSREISIEAIKQFPDGQVMAFESKEAVIAKIRELVLPSDIILIKGSRGMEMEKVVEGIL